MERAWRVHHAPLMLRRWYHDIGPIDFSTKEVPTWVTIWNVPPQLVTPKGISWIASKIGRPMNHFVRDGLLIKVCVMCDESSDKPTELELTMGDAWEIRAEVELRWPLLP
ncbi:hypothetical protein LINPERHAP1_LOCUS10731 [Linum perenne]